MDYRSATPGQVKQLIAKLVQAVPVDTLYFEEVERMLRDPRFADDINCLFRRYRGNKPVPVIPSILPLDDLMGLVDRFFYVDERLNTHPVSFEHKNPHVDAVLAHIKAMSPPVSGMVELDVIGFDHGIPYQDKLRTLQEMGYRGASLNEAVGFLQARGKTLENVSKDLAVISYSFVIIADSCYIEFNRSSKSGTWDMCVIDGRAGEAFCSSNVLVAKL